MLLFHYNNMHDDDDGWHAFNIMQIMHSSIRPTISQSIQRYVSSSSLSHSLLSLFSLLPLSGQLVVIFSKFSVLTSKTGMFAELQETLHTATGPIQTTAVGHLHGALFVQNAIATQELSCKIEEEKEKKLINFEMHAFIINGSMVRKVQARPGQARPDHKEETNKQTHTRKQSTKFGSQAILGHKSAKC